VRRPGAALTSPRADIVRERDTLCWRLLQHVQDCLLPQLCCSYIALVVVKLGVVPGFVADPDLVHL
jgi:hypothetical protein